MTDLIWKKNIPGKSAWGTANDGWDYAVDVYDHGMEVVVTVDDEDGNNKVYRKVESFEAGKQVAETYHRARISVSG